MASRREQAGLPTGPGRRALVLDLLKKQTLPVHRNEIGDLVAKHLGLSDEQRAIREAAKGGGDGSRTYVAWMSEWACNHLKQIGVCEQPSRGLYQLTAEGRVISAEEVENRWRDFRRQQVGRRQQDSRNAEGTEHIGRNDSDEEEQNDWRQELVDRLLAMHPDSFERLSGRLLEAAGFDEVQVTGQVADGGIDAVGVYRPSGLISFRTSVQCKRWQGSVGRDRVQAFQGASMPKSDRGIIITTGTFTEGAKAQAQAPGAFPVDLIDGSQLAELLKQFKLGVHTTTVELVTVDHSFFAEYEESQ